MNLSYLTVFAGLQNPTIVNYTHVFEVIPSSFPELNLPQAHPSILHPKYQSSNLFVV